VRERRAIERRTNVRESLDELVRTVVARHLQVSPTTLTARTHVHRDLELDPLDLVLIALRIEGLEGMEFPIARLERVRTIADLVGIVRTMRRGRTEEPAFTLDDRRLKRAAGA